MKYLAEFFDTASSSSSSSTKPKTNTKDESDVPRKDEKTLKTLSFRRGKIKKENTK